MICKNCNTYNDKDMAFCQNCGEKLNTIHAHSDERLTAATPVSNSIKNVSNLVFGIMVALGCIGIAVGVIAMLITASYIALFVGLLTGSLLIVFGYIVKAFIDGYSVIVSYCERRNQ